MESIKSKLSFWGITGLLHVFLFLGYSFVSNNVATPIMVEQKISNFSEEENIRRLQVETRMDAHIAASRAREEAIFATLNGMAISLNTLQENFRFFAENQNELKADSREIKARILEIERRN